MSSPVLTLQFPISQSIVSRIRTLTQRLPFECRHLLLALFSKLSVEDAKGKPSFAPVPLALPASALHRDAIATLSPLHLSTLDLEASQ